MPNLIPYRKGDLWGYCDSNRNIKIEPQFLYSRPFAGDYAEVVIDSVTRGIIDKGGSIIVSVGKDTVAWVSNSRIINVSHEYIDRIIKLREVNGQWVQFDKYIINERFSEGIYIAKSAKKFGIINREGKILLPFKYKDISPPDEKGFVRIVKNSGRVIFLDTSLKKALLKLNPKYDIGGFNNDRASISFNGKKNALTGFINRDGQIVISMIYKKTSIFIDGICEVSDGIKSGFINTKGDTVISFKYGSPIYLRNGYINYRQPLVSTLYDLKDKEIFRLKTYDIDYVNDSMIVVSKYGPGSMPSLKWGIVDTSGKEIWPCTFHSIYSNLYPGLIYVLENWRSQPYYMDYKFNKYYED